MTNHEEFLDLLLEAHPRPHAGPHVNWPDVLRRAGVRPRRRNFAPRRFALLAVVAAAVAAVVLTNPFGSGKVDVLGGALAAVGAGPVVHAVVEYSWPQDIVVDLATGAEREQTHRDEFWYDEQRQELMYHSFVGGERHDYLMTAAGSASLDPALAGFAARYRQALASGTARVMGAAAVNGRRAKRIQFNQLEAGAVEDVLVDARTYAPLSFQVTFPGGRRSPLWRVATIESVPYDPLTFQTPSPRPKPRPAGGAIRGERHITLSEAAGALDARPLWLGPSFAGHALDSVRLSETTAQLTDGSNLSGVFVRLDYGAVGVSLARDAAGSYALGFGEDDYPTPPEGSIGVTGNDREGWQGKLRHGNFAVSVTARSKEEVIAAARALTPQR